VHHDCVKPCDLDDPEDILQETCVEVIESTNFEFNDDIFL